MPIYVINNSRFIEFRPSIIYSIPDLALINCEKLTVKGKNKLKNLRNTKLVIDVTESEIERPKKIKKTITLAKRKNIHSKLRF